MRIYVDLRMAAGSPTHPSWASTGQTGWSARPRAPRPVGGNRVSARIAMTAVAVAALVSTALPVVASAASTASVAGTSASEQVVVLFKNQFPDHPASRSGLSARRSAIVLNQRNVQSAM